MKAYSDRIEQIKTIAEEMLEFQEKRNLKEETKGRNIMTPEKIKKGTNNLCNNKSNLNCPGRR